MIDRAFLRSGSAGSGSKSRGSDRSCILKAIQPSQELPIAYACTIVHAYAGLVAGNGLARGVAARWPVQLTAR